MLVCHFLNKRIYWLSHYFLGIDLIIKSIHKLWLQFVEIGLTSVQNINTLHCHGHAARGVGICFWHSIKKLNCEKTAQHNKKAGKSFIGSYNKIMLT